MAKLCSIVRHSLLFIRWKNRQEVPKGRSTKALSATAKGGKYHRGSSRCSRVALPNFLSVYTVLPNVGQVFPLGHQGFAKVAWLSEGWPPAAAFEGEKECGRLRHT